MSRLVPERLEGERTPFGLSYQQPTRRDGMACGRWVIFLRLPRIRISVSAWVRSAVIALEISTPRHRFVWTPTQ